MPESNRLKPQDQMMGWARNLPIIRPLMKPISAPEAMPISSAGMKPRLMNCTVSMPAMAMVMGMDMSFMLPE